MTNLDSLLKSRDITLPTKVCLIKAMVFPVVITFLPRSKHLLISWLQSPSAVILEPKKILKPQKKDMEQIVGTQKERQKTGETLFIMKHLFYFGYWTRQVAYIFEATFE